MTLIANGDSVVWPPCAAVDADIKVEGGGSNYDAIRTDQTFTYSFGTNANMSATNTMIRVWFMYTFPSYLNTQANGGIQLGLSDGSNTAYWYVSGSDKHKGTWELLQADISATPNTGTTPNLSSISNMYIVLDHATNARNVDNTYIDIAWFGIGIEFYGGTTSDKVTWNTLSVSDTGLTTSKQYGILEWVRNGAYYLNHAIFIGDSSGTNNTYFDGSGETIVFYSANEKSGAYQLKATGNSTGTTSIDFSGAVLLSASTPFILDMSSANLSSLDMEGASVKNSSSCLFKSGQTIESVAFTDCSSVNPNGASINSCSFLDSTVVTSTLNILSACSFTSSGTGHGVNLGTVSSSITMNWNCNDSGYTASSSGNETILVNVASGQTLTINVGAGYSTPSVYNTGTGTVTVVSGQVTTQIEVKDLTTGLVVENARVLVYVSDGTNFPYLDSISITGTGTTATVTHTSHGLKTGDSVIINGANEDVYNGAHIITVTGVNTYTYTTVSTISSSPATGTITSTFAFINGLTNASGVISDTRSLSSNQPIIGRVRKASSSPYYQQGSIAGTVTTANGFSTTVQLIRDE